VKRSYEEKMAFIRPFVSFDFKRPGRTVPKTKSKITRYFNFLESNQNNFVAVRPPRGNFEKIQREVNPTFARIPKKIKRTEFKVLFLPTEERAAKVTYSKKKKKWVLKKSKMVEEIIIFEDTKTMVKNPAAYVDRLVKKFPAKTFFRLFNPQGWRDAAFDRDAIGREIARMVARYPKEANKFMQGLVAEDRKNYKFPKGWG